MTDWTPRAERAYEFRRRLGMVHTPNRRDEAATPDADEVVVGEGWSIVVGARCEPLVLETAKDLQDYLLSSMGESVLLRRVGDVAAAARAGRRVIVLGTREELPDVGGPLTAARSYRLVCEGERVVVCGRDARGAAQGSYHVEDLMNLRAAPFLRARDETRAPLFGPRMTHSGWALDEFPDAHLNAIAHAGMDAILVFTSGVDRTPDHSAHDHRQPWGGRYVDFNDLVDRAERFGLDVYFYAYFQSALRTTDAPYPDDPGAEQWYADRYGAVFRACPRAKGIVLVGESIEFPSKDPQTTGQPRQPRAPGEPRPEKPTPGWWPCDDWVDWLEMIKRVVRPHNPEADIVFWTYNWGYAPEEDRLRLIRALPRDVSLQVTFEMFEPVTRNGLTNMCADYTISFVGPGRYFASEARAAHERGLRLYAMANTGGLTWDFGVIPYEPVPYQWARRHEALLAARREWGLSGLMENHHFGWWPSFVSELAKWSYWSPSPATEETLEAIARRDFGGGAHHALAAWKSWSEAVEHYVATGHDQYGPFRIGPSYPLVFQEPAKPSADWYAMWGGRIASTTYNPGMGRNRQLPEHQRLDVSTRVELETRSLQRMEALWREGAEQLRQAVSQAPAQRRAEAERQLGLATFILHAVVTAVHAKRWWTLKQRVLADPAPSEVGALLDEMAALAEREITNAEAAIPLVRADSRIGWEPTMGYLADEAHLRWKIAHVRRVLDQEIPQYRRTVGSAERGAAGREN